MRVLLGLQLLPRVIGHGEEVLADADTDQDNGGRWTFPRGGVGDQHLTSQIGVVADHVRTGMNRNWVSGEGGRPFVQPLKAVLVEGAKGPKNNDKSMRISEVGSGMDVSSDCAISRPKQALCFYSSTSLSG